MGRFRWNGQEYDGIHEPIVPVQLWQAVQDILEGRYAHQGGRARREFVFSSLIRCGWCDCALVAEIKKGRYMYYHCTGNRGKCPGPYARQELLEALRPGSQRPFAG
jgi:site-specific DNA recombinase